MLPYPSREPKRTGLHATMITSMAITNLHGTDYRNNKTWEQKTEWKGKGSRKLYLKCHENKNVNIVQISPKNLNRNRILDITDMDVNS